MEKKEPQTSSEEAGPVPAVKPARPFRPLSRRRRQEREQLVDPVSRVERPNTSVIFDASPATVAAALTKAKKSAADTTLAWGAPDDPPAADPASDGDDTPVG